MRATESHDLVLNDVIVPFENFVETKHKPQQWMDFTYTKCIFRYCPSSEIMLLSLPKYILLIVLREQLLRYLLYNKMLGKWNHSYYLHVIFMSTARGYNQYNETLNIWNETSASKILVMNQGLEVVDLAMRIVGAKV